jgi:septal ring-binding cell division protein DamX
MDTTVLQQKLAEQRHLLPSQHELLNRLLFQLAFNDFQNIGLVGAEGSGKSTLALALAELFSEQANVALVNGALPEAELETQLLQHWFGRRQSEPSLAQMMAQPASGALPLLLVVDNFNLLSSSARKKLLQLDCLSFFMLSEALADMALNLNINMPTLQDASQVLSDKQLEPLAVAERFAASRGNMHLLHSAIVKPEERRAHSAAVWLLPTAIMLLVLAAGINWLLPGSNEQRAPVITGQKELAQISAEPNESIQHDGSPEPVSTESESNNLEPVNSLELEATALDPEINSPEPEITAPEPETTAPEPETNSLEPETNGPELATNSSEPATTDLQQDISPEQSATTEAASSNTSPAESVDTLISASIAEQAATTTELMYQEALLLTLPADARVLQLAVLSSETALQRFNRTYPDTGIMVYQRSWQGQLQWIILSEQHYSDVSSARLARTLLPARLRETGPFIKPVVQVQQEIKALARLRAEAQMQE